MSIFYPDDLVIYGLSINSFLPFNVQDDVLAKVRRNFFEHNRRQNDKLVQNFQDITIKYSYNLEKNKSMKWVVQKNKKTIEDSVIVSVNSYEIRTYNDNAEKISATEYSNDHIFKQVTFSLNDETMVISSGKENNKSVLFMRGNSVNNTLHLLQINERQEVIERLRVRNPYISVTALTNLGLVYFGTDEEINNVKNIIKDIKAEIDYELAPKVYITEEDVKSGFNFKDNDFNLKRNMNETYDIDKSEYFSFEEDVVTSENTENVEEITQENIEKNTVETTETEAVVEVVDELVIETVEESVIETAKEPVTETIEESVAETVEESESVTEEVEEDDELLELIKLEEESFNADISDLELLDEAPDEVEENSVEENKNETEESSADENNEILQQVIDAMIDSGAKKISSDDEEGESPVRFMDETSDQNEENEADLIINSGGERYLYFGDVNDDLERDGYGRTEMSDGKTAYEGNYKNNKRHGFGSFYYKDGGLCYTGEWKENKREGFGVGLRSSDGSYHAGNWSGNKPNGIGARFDKYGNFSYATNYVNGKEDGLSVQFNDDGSISIFKWENDSKKTIQRIYP